MMPEWMKPYRIGQLIFPRLIKKCKYLKYLPIVRQYAPGGEFDPDREDDLNTDEGLTKRLRKGRP